MRYSQLTHPNDRRGTDVSYSTHQAHRSKNANQHHSQADQISCTGGCLTVDRGPHITDLFVHINLVEIDSGVGYAVPDAPTLTANRSSA
jgi:hypothetical protein